MMQKKQVIFLFMALAAALILLLVSSSLSQLELTPGEPLPMGNMASTLEGTFMPKSGEIILQLIRLFFLLAIISIPILVVLLIVSPKARRQFLREMVRVIPMILLVILFGRIARLVRAPENEEVPAPQAGDGLSPDFVPGGELVMPELSNQWTVVAIVAIAVTITVIIGLIVWFTLRNSKRTPDVRERILAQTGRALRQIEMGGEVRDVIQRCYREMNTALREQRGVQRRANLTTQEFQEHLVGLGFPARAVRTLTHLFEEVRYGSKTGTPEMVDEAVACLTELMESMREGA